jgi:prophage maintenance system killer protein
MTACENHLSSKDLLLIAEARLGLSYDVLERLVCPFRAESALAAPFVRVCGTLLFPDPVEQAAICAHRLILTKPFPWGNRAVGYECMREMLALSGRRWSPQEEEAEDVDDFLRCVEDGEVGLAEFMRWVRARVRPGRS